MLAIVRKEEGVTYERRLGDTVEVERVGKGWVFRVLSPEVPRHTIAREVFALILASKDAVLDGGARSAVYVLSRPKSVPVTRVTSKKFECRAGDRRLILEFLTDEMGEVRACRCSE